MKEFTDQEVHDWLVSEMYGVTCWLHDFSDGRRKRPDHEIAAKRHRRDVIEFLLSRYPGAHAQISVRS